MTRSSTSRNHAGMLAQHIGCWLLGDSDVISSGGFLIDLGVLSLSQRRLNRSPGLSLVEDVEAQPEVSSTLDLLSGHRKEEEEEEEEEAAGGAGEEEQEEEKGALRFRGKGTEEGIPPKMALTPRSRGGGNGGGGGGGREDNISEELANEDEGANAANFEPLSDSCGESDMEGLDLSLFEPQVDVASWCDSRVHAGTLHILVHYCEAECCVGEAASEACWEPCYCVLLQDEQTLTAYRSEDMARREVLISTFLVYSVLYFVNSLSHLTAASSFSSGWVPSSSTST
ncbi:hypothetical protein EAI_13041 [Harpegnathos saltator]|uniref:Uncharacterized protein n=1 Tax=Harpegnathos saltator TaxID=610380 RepID=E2B6A5_HARSA|nr:hypothetical protein EAI_13041 [Harpegnathos saltator]